MTHFEIWSHGQPSVLDPYATRTEALASVVAILAEAGTPAVLHLTLVAVDADGVALDVASGVELIRLATEQPEGEVAARCLNCDRPSYDDFCSASCESIWLRDQSGEDDPDDEPPDGYGPPGSGAIITEYSGFEPGLNEEW